VSSEQRKRKRKRKRKKSLRRERGKWADRPDPPYRG
jgi:hypothetical protein